MDFDYGGDGNLNDDDDVKSVNGIKIYLNDLLDRIDEKTLNGIRDDFQQNANGRLNQRQLRAVLESNGVALSAEDLKPLFCKIDVRKESAVNFLQFVVYLAYELRVKSKPHELDEEKPAKFALKLMPSKQIRDEIKKDIETIAFKPLTDNETSRTTAVHDDGEYVTISRSGEIAFYTMDFEFKKSFKILKSMRSSTATRLTGLAVLPNYNVVCVSTLAGELRFYNALADGMRLCLTVERVPSTTTCLAYDVSNTAETSSGARSKIAVGNVAGGVVVFEFSSADNKDNPFWSVDDTHSPSYVLDDIIEATAAETAGGVKQYRSPFNAFRFAGLHSDPVNQVEFYDAGKWFVSVSGDSHRSMAYCRVWIESGSSPVCRYASVADGFWCVCAIDNERVATGGMDSSVRLWDAVLTAMDGRQSKTSIRCADELAGHEKAVQHVFYNRANGHLYSVSADRAIKVWDVRGIGACLYTFGDAAAATDAFDYRRRVPALFNRRESMIAMAVGDAFVSVKCGKDTDGGSRRVTDGSHDTPVTKTMYNRLFRVLISVSGEDSVIAVWNLSTGDLITKRAMAHTRELFGQTLPVEITAANFDASGGLLVTGAVNGTVHLWDPNNGTCLNRLQIPSKCRISEVIWLANKILVVGWDRRVTQFDDPLVKSNDKVWLSSHKDVVLSACVQLPFLLVTTTRAGEIAFWHLGTGQLIKKHADRKAKDETFEKSDTKHRYEQHSAVASHFLRSRPETQTVGTLFVAMRSGVVQMWCTHKVFSHVARFVATHVDDDYVTAMASDSQSDFLITSTERGYVKTWYIADFGVGQPVRAVHSTSSEVVASLTLRFPFLSESFTGHATTNEDTAGPLLVNSYRAHLQSIRHVEYVDTLELVVTSGTDKSIRVWTLEGHYVGTLGSPWFKISKTSAVKVTTFSIPSDIEREGSSTTIRVLKNFQTTNVSKELQVLRKRRLSEARSQTETLSDIYDELMERVKNETPLTDPTEIDIEESMRQIISSIHTSLTEINTVPNNIELKGIINHKPKTKETRLAFNL